MNLTKGSQGLCLLDMAAFLQAVNLTKRRMSLLVLKVDQVFKALKVDQV